MAQINGISSKNNYGFYAVVNEIIPENYIDTNKTIIDYHVYIKNNGMRFNSNNWTKYAQVDGTDIYRQTNQNIASNSVGFNDSLEIISGTKEIEHTADGSKTITFSAGISKSSYGSYDPGICSLSGDIPLTTIPRASSVLAFVGNPGYATNINIKRASNSFTHKLSYNFQGLTGDIGNGIGDSFLWSIPDNFYQKIPSKVGVKGTIYCETYNGTTKIGNTTSTEFTVNPVEADCLPDVEATIVETNTALNDLTTKLVRFASKPKITITATPKKYATITEKKASCGNKSGTGDVVILENIEDGNFLITATDSREYVNSKSKSLEMVPYIKLTANIEVYRTSQTGSEVKARINGNYFEGNFGKADNSLSVKFRYREKSGTFPETYTTLTPTINEDNTYSGDLLLGTNFNYKKSYEFEFIVKDKIMTVTVIPEPIGHGVPIWARFEKFLEAWGIPVFWKDDNDIVRLNVDLIYPVGSIYMSVNSTNPSTIFGGTWTQLKNAYLFATNATSGTKGTGSGSGNITGEANGDTGSTVLSIEQIPSHTHISKHLNSTTGNTNGWIGQIGTLSTEVTGESGGNQGHTHTLNGHTHTIPYLEIYVWKRTK